MTDRPMTQIEELVERLREFAEHLYPVSGDYAAEIGDIIAAADALSTLLRERDEAREYGAQARIRENAAEDARIHEHTRAESAEAQVERMREALEAVLPYAESAWDEGPGDEGWQSATLQDICTRARAALEPKP